MHGVSQMKSLLKNKMCTTTTSKKRA